MDSGSSSEAKMTAQASDTVCNLDECVKIAEMSASKLVNDSLQPDPTPYYKPVNIQYKIANEGFPKFSKLPAELRSKVWQDAMPPYGIFAALMLGREEPRPQQPPPPAPLAFRVVYRLEPVPRDQQHDDLRKRLDTMRAIQSTTSEAAAEVQRAFPTTINCTGGKMRFNAEHDTLSLSAMQCLLRRGFFSRFKGYSDGTIVFEDDWHKIPRKLALAIAHFSPFGNLDHYLRIPKGPNSSSGWPDPVFVEHMEGFMDFLADCTELRSFGLMHNKVCDDRVMYMGRFQLRALQYEVLPFCRPVPALRHSFYDDRSAIIELGGFRDLVAGLHGLEAVVHGPRPGQELPLSCQGFRLGRPALQHIHLQALVPAHPTVYGRVEEVVKMEE